MSSIQQIKRLIAAFAVAAAWPSPPGNPVYTGGSVISEDLEGAFSPGSIGLDGPAPAALPFCRVSFAGAELDEEVQGRIDVARFRLWSTAGGGDQFPGTTATAAPGFDGHGVNMETGALYNAVQPAGKSDGKSTDQLWSALVAALGPNGQFVNSIHGFQGRATRVETEIPVDGVQVLTRPIEIEVYDATVSDT